MRACTDDGDAWTRNASEIYRKQLAMCRRCAHALMRLTPGRATSETDLMQLAMVAPGHATSEIDHNAMQINCNTICNALPRACTHDGPVCTPNA